MLDCPLLACNCTVFINALDEGIDDVHAQFGMILSYDYQSLILSNALQNSVIVFFLL